MLTGLWLMDPLTFAFDSFACFTEVKPKVDCPLVPCPKGRDNFALDWSKAREAKGKSKGKDLNLNLNFCVLILFLEV